MSISMQEVRILIMENAKESLQLSLMRKRREIQRVTNDAVMMEKDLAALEYEIHSMRDAWLIGGCQ